jgi:hypothetical protein
MPLAIKPELPACFGGLIALGEGVYKTTAGVVLLLAGSVMILRQVPAAEPDVALGPPYRPA